LQPPAAGDGLTLPALANKRDVPYQSLLKLFLADRVSREMRTGDVLPRRAPQPTLAHVCGRRS